MQKKKYNGDYIYIHFTFSVCDAAMRLWECFKQLGKATSELPVFLFFLLGSNNPIKMNCMNQR